ncbi:hypothetical protein GOODEAATRI_030153, partial [Goodea atripinnis]
ILDKQKELEVLKESRKLLEEEIMELRSQMLELQSSSGTEKQIGELNTSVHTITEQKRQLEEHLQQLLEKITDLANNLEIVEAERNFLLSEKENNLQNHKEEMEKLQFSLMALSQKNDLLQEVLDLQEELQKQKERRALAEVELDSSQQDLLLSRVGAPKYSVNNQDFHSLWNQRLSELLVKHQLYQQKMESILEKLWANLTSYLSVRRAEIIERVKFKEALQAGINQPVFNELECILSQEAERRRSVIQNVKRLLQVRFIFG